MQHHNLPRTLVTATILLMIFTGCIQQTGNKGEIPVDPSKAAVHVIPIEEARQLMTGYETGKKELSAQLPPGYLDSAFSIPVAEMFNRDAIALLLNVKGAANIRVYVGRDSKGLVKMVLLPADSSGNDIITQLLPYEKALRMPGVSSAFAQGGGGQALENGQRCPPICSKPNPPR